MLGLFTAGGALMWPILLCSVISLTLICERNWFLRVQRITPDNTLNQALGLLNHMDKAKLETFSHGSPLAKILATALKHSGSDMYLISERVQDAGRHVLHDLEKYLSALGTIAMITPLLGLLGTVVGMIDVFSNIMLQGVGQSQALSGGIATALLTTAAGLLVAIPSLIAHRYFERQLENISVELEQQTGVFLDAIRRKKAAQRKADLAEAIYLQEATA